MVAVPQQREVVAQVEEILTGAVATREADQALPAVATVARVLGAWARHLRERLDKLGQPGGAAARRLEQVRGDAAALDQVAEGIAISAEAIAAIATPAREDAARKLAALEGPLSGLRGAMILIHRLATASAVEAEVRAWYEQAFAELAADPEWSSPEAAAQDDEEVSRAVALDDPFAGLDA